jgi:hypothetical protein
MLIKMNGLQIIVCCIFKIKSFLFSFLWSYFFFYSYQSFIWSFIFFMYKINMSNNDWSTEQVYFKFLFFNLILIKIFWIEVSIIGLMNEEKKWNVLHPNILILQWLLFKKFFPIKQYFQHDLVIKNNIFI